MEVESDDTTAPQAMWRKSQLVGRLLEVLNDRYTPLPTGALKVKEGLFPLRDIDVWTLSLLFPFSEAIPESERAHVMWKAVSDVRKLAPLTTENLAVAAARKEIEYKTQPVTDFVLLTTLSLEPRSDLRKITTESAELKFSRRRPRAFIEPNHVELARTQIRAKLPNGYTFIRVFTRSKTAAEAWTLAHDQLDFLRAIWNMLLCYGRWQITGQTNAFSKIVAGPIATLHRLDGTPAVDNYWWDPFYLESVPALKLDKKKFRSLRKGEAWIRKRIQRAKFASTLEKAMTEFGKALDDYNHQSGFTRLWAILERLTGTENSPHTKTVKRAAAFYRNKNADLDEYVLDAFRKNRNRIVHSGHHEHDAETAMGRLKTYVERLLILLMIHGGRFKNWEEVLECMDAPRGSDKVSRRILNYQWISQLRESGATEPGSS